jgi:hypothetical protein
MNLIMVLQWPTAILRLVKVKKTLSLIENTKTPHKAGFLVVARPRLELGTEGL